MSSETEALSMTLVGFQSNRIPEMLGTFKLDDHNIEEWDDDSSDLDVKRRGRKECGKWIDLERNADIKFQRVEDSEKSGKGADRQRTEIIEGKAPDSSFRIIRSQCQFNNNNSDTGTNEVGSRQSSVVTSYQMSSTNGVRTTSKTSSNKTSTKTVTVSSNGGGRSLQSNSDDFENLKVAFRPLDSSTQRERLNMIRNSGTMGLKRRPPTRKHTRTSTVTDSPNTFHNSVDEIYEDAVAKNFSEQTSASLPLPKSNGDLSIVSYKNISPKLRVGFPVEIQVELRSKLRDGGSSSFSASNEALMNGESKHSDNYETPILNGDLCTTSITNLCANGKNKNNNTILKFDLERESLDKQHDINSNERRKSYAFESFDLKENGWKNKVYTPSSESSTNVYDNLLKNSNADPVFPSRLDHNQGSNSTNNFDNYTYDSIENILKSLESSPSPELSRKLIKLTSETEDSNDKATNKSEVLNDISTKPASFFTNNLYEPSENFPNYRRNSVMGILSSGNDELYTRYSKPFLSNENHSALLDFSSFSKNNHTNKVSHTWISSIDGPKPSQTARDEYVTTSISATNNQLTKPQKKVEFCVTEVHFIPESGKFNIVKSDENKPSTVHLFRRKKRQKSSVRSLETITSDALLPNTEKLSNDDSGYAEYEVDLYAEKSTNSYSFVNANENLSDASSKPRENIILPNSCEELQIQRFLKQLKPSSSNSSTTTESESSIESIDTLIKSTTEMREKFDGNTAYENGSFVPYVIRQSLIDMNNRNGVKSLDHLDPNHNSDNCSTASTYSLPKSDHSREQYYSSLKLIGLDAALENIVNSRKVTSSEFVYSEDENEKDTNKNNWRSNTSRSKSDNFLFRSSPERIPTPVMPSGLRTMPPYRNDVSTISSPSLYDDGYSFERSSSKPPTPVLPLHFSTFEKTGAALRERFYAKNPRCMEFNILPDEPSTDRSKRTINSERDTQATHSETSEENFEQRLQRISRNNFQAVTRETEPDISPSLENNVDGASPSRTVARSLTFPKSNRPEPEWVIKAKLKAISREARVEDWSLLGNKPAISSCIKNEEPPWISELNHRRNRRIHQHSIPNNDKVEEASPGTTHIYPWNRTTQSKDLYTRSPYNAKLQTSSTPGLSNKSIVDLNRDSDSILIEPIQIEVKQEKTANSKPNSENVKQISDVETKELKPGSGQTNSRYKKQQENSARIPLQALTSENKTSGKSKAKPVSKSPDRNISSRKVQTTTFSASVDKKIQPASTEAHKRDPPPSEFRQVKSEKTTPIIHRHPTVKISKLPTKSSNRKHVSSPEGRSKPSQIHGLRNSKEKDNKQHQLMQGGDIKASGKIRMGHGIISQSLAKMSQKH